MKALGFASADETSPENNQEVSKKCILNYYNKTSG